MANNIATEKNEFMERVNDYSMKTLMDMLNIFEDNYHIDYSNNFWDWLGQKYKHNMERFFRLCTGVKNPNAEIFMYCLKNGKAEIEWFNADEEHTIKELIKEHIWDAKVNKIGIFGTI